MDCSIVTTAMMMEAHELGLGTLWARGFNSRQLQEGMGLPEGMELVCFLDIGYEAEEHQPSPLHFKRRPLEESVSFL